MRDAGGFGVTFSKFAGETRHRSRFTPGASREETSRSVKRNDGAALALDLRSHLSMTWRTFLHRLLLLSAVYLLAGTTADPDLWGHVRFGQDMLSARTVHVADSYSFASDKPWVNHEWLSEVLMAASFNAFGPAGLVVLRLAMVAAVMILLWSAFPRHHHFTWMALSTAALGIFLRAYPIRPQLASLLMFAIVSLALYRAEEKQSLRPALVIPPAMAIWVNLHGGWIVGLGIVVLWGALRMINASRIDRVLILLLVGAAAGATLGNPYGTGIWSFVAETVRVERSMIADWQPTYMLPPPFWAPWLVSAALVLLAVRRGLPPGSWRLLAVTASLAVMTLRVSRLDAFFAISAVLLLARSLSHDRAAATAAVPAIMHPALRWSFAVCVMVMSIAATARASAIRAVPEILPDRHVVEFMRQQRLQGRMLTWFDWGQYVIWHFGPALQVSMDGRRETVYSDQVVSAHLKFYFGERDEWRYADELRADYALLPAGLPVVKRLQEHGWRTMCSGAEAVLLSRHAGDSCGPSTAAAPRRFPDL